MTRDGGVILSQNPASLIYWGDMRGGPPPPRRVHMLAGASPPRPALMTLAGGSCGAVGSGAASPPPSPTIPLHATFLSRLFALEKQLLPEFLEDVSMGFEWQGVLRVPPSGRGGGARDGAAAAGGGIKAHSMSQLPTMFGGYPS